MRVNCFVRNLGLFFYFLLFCRSGLYFPHRHKRNLTSYFRASLADLTTTPPIFGFFALLHFVTPCLRFGWMRYKTDVEKKQKK